MGTEVSESVASKGVATSSVDDDLEGQRRQSADQGAGEARKGEDGAEKEETASSELTTFEPASDAEVGPYLCLQSQDQHTKPLSYRRRSLQARPDETA